MALVVKIFTVILSIIFIVGELSMLYSFWLTVVSYKHRDPKNMYSTSEEDVGLNMLYLSISLLIAIAWFILCAKIYL